LNEKGRLKSLFAFELLRVDGGYPAHEQLDAVAEQTEVYAPVPNDPHAPKARDSEAVAAWRQRMGTEEAKHLQRPGGDRRMR